MQKNDFSQFEKAIAGYPFLEIDFAFEIGVKEWSDLEKYLYIICAHDTYDCCICH